MLKERDVAKVWSADKSCSVTAKHKTEAKQPEQNRAEHEVDEVLAALGAADGVRVELHVQQNAVGILDMVEAGDRVQRGGGAAAVKALHGGDAVRQRVAGAAAVGRCGRENQRQLRENEQGVR